MAKAPDAFRTISEVADTLDTPAHVLRFWESKFSQIKPVKRAGGRRYYRPQDVSLLAGIKTLLHSQGMTIKGAQKLLRENGIKHVQAIGTAAIEGTTPVDTREDAPAAPAPAEPTASIADEIAATATEEQKQPTLEISNITAFRRRAPDADPVPDMGATPVTKTAPALPPNPTMDETRPPRYFGAINRLDDAAIKAKAAQIVPLLARLETVRDQMRKR